MNVFALNGETALITGGGSGLGLAMSRCFHAAGAKVVLAGRREQVLKNAVSELGEGAGYVVHDVTETHRATTLIQDAERISDSPVSILVNNAGNHLKTPAVDTSSEKFSEVLHTHVTAAHALTRAVLPGMLEREHGNILFTASMASLIGIPLVSAYASAKTALVGLTRTLAAEVGPAGVRVNAIAPGWIETPMLRKALDGDAARAEKILSRTPMARFGTASDIGWAAVYLCSPAAGFVNGVLLPVDGGASIGF